MAEPMDVDPVAANKAAIEQAVISTVKLPNGKDIPVIGVGTWLTSSEDVGANVLMAARMGYRHFDCAERYQNQKAIGAAFRKLWIEGWDRRDFFFTSKLWNTRHHKVDRSLRRTISNLDLGYLDLYLVHFPESFPPKATEEEMAAGTKEFANVPIKSLWKDLEYVVDRGWVRGIGVSNFAISEIEEILSFAKHPPVVNQIEVHPYHANVELVEYCQSKNIAVVAYSTLANQHFLDAVDPHNPRRAGVKLPPLLQNEVVVKISEKHKKTPAQVVLRWGVQRNMIVLQKSLREERLRENAKIFDFALDDGDMAELTGLDQKFRLVNPGWRKWPGEGY